MIQRILLGLSCLSFICIAQADDFPLSLTQDPAFSYERGYTDLLIGSQNMSNPLNIKTTELGLPYQPTVHMNATRTDFGLSAGYGSIWAGNNYFAIEASTLPMGVTGSGTHWNSYEQASFKYELTRYDLLNFDVLPGYRLSQNFLVYARAGVALSYNKFDQSRNGVEEYNSNFYQFGGRLGVGGDYQISSHIALGADYIYTQYISEQLQKTTASGSTENFDIQKPKDRLLALHLRYYF